MKNSHHNHQTPKQKSAGSSKLNSDDYVNPRQMKHSMQVPNYQSVSRQIIVMSNME